MSKKGEMNLAEAVLVHGPTKLTSEMKAASKAKLEELMKEEMQEVAGIFQYYEVPGGSTKITVQKYPGHMFEKTMTDQMIYKIPKYVARHLNGIDITAGALAPSNERRDQNIGTCGYEVHQAKQDGAGELVRGQVSGNGVFIPAITKKFVRRFGFNYLEHSGISA